MDRFDRRSFTPSERATADVCYHHLTLVMATAKRKCDVDLLTDFRERMTRSLNHMVRNQKIESFGLVCDWSNNSQDSIQDDEEIRMEITLSDSNLFPVAPVKINLSRTISSRALDDNDNMAEALEDVWDECLPSFDRRAIEKGFQNLMVLNLKKFWPQLRNTQDGRTLVINAVNKSLEMLHSNLMIDQEESTIKCHEMNQRAKPEDDIEAVVYVESRSNSRMQLDVCVAPKLN